MRDAAWCSGRANSACCVCLDSALGFSALVLLTSTTTWTGSRIRGLVRGLEMLIWGLNVDFCDAIIFSFRTSIRLPHSFQTNQSLYITNVLVFGPTPPMQM